MNNQDAKTAWGIAGVLAIIVVILLGVMAYRWYDEQPKDYGQVLQEGSEDITVIRDRIRMHCTATDEDSRARCADDLEDLGDILSEFSEDVANSTTTVESAN